MKKNFLVLLLLGLINPVIADNEIKKVEHYSELSHLLTTDDYRQKLYEWEKDNSEVFILDDFPIDYSIDILRNHIKSLEVEIKEKKFSSLLDGALISGFSGFWGYVSYVSYQKMINIRSAQDITVDAYIKILTGNTEAMGSEISGSTLVSYIKDLENDLEVTPSGIAALSGISVLLAGIAAVKAYEMFSYIQHLKKNLAQDKRILIALQEIKNTRII
ncbi:MAG TPA: hypothetical protein VKU36_04105 [Candidatus Babeliales bacterium]|nr:hypothetical protein [Candidatus Babeliales bacterium]